MTAREYFDIFRKRWPLVVGGLIVGLIVAAAVTWLTPRQYSASVTIFVSAQTPIADASAVAANELPVQRMTTYVELLTSKKVSAEVATQLGLPASELAGNITASTVPETVLLTATATSTSPERAAAIANLVAERFIQNVAKLEQPPDPLARPLVAAQVYEPATPPTDPVAPRPGFNFILGAVLGLLLGLGAALVRNLLDTSLTSLRQLRQVVGAPVLGAVSLNPDAAAHPLIMRDDPQAPGAEAFRQLRTNLQFVDVDRAHKVVLVTSAAAGEGKTTTVCNLAVALADAGSRVLVIEADLRRPNAAELFGLDRTVGLTNVLANRMHLGQVVQRWEGVLDVVPSGPIPPNPSELLGSQQMTNIIDEARAHYDMVLIDSSPLSPVTDPAALAPRVDGVLLVVRHGTTSTNEVRNARDALDAVSARLLGAIMTMVPTKGMRRYVGTDPYLAQPPAPSRPRAGERPRVGSGAGAPGRSERGGGVPGSAYRPSPTPRGGIPSVPADELVDRGKG